MLTSGMKSSSSRFNAAWLVALLALSIISIGCVGVVPLPVSRTKVEHGQRLTPAEVAFVQPGKTTRAEVLSQLGTNCLSLPLGRAIAYSWEMKGGGYAWWWFVACPNAAAGDGGIVTGGWRAYFVAFDDRGVATASAFKSPSTSRSLHEHLDHWISRLPAQPQVDSIR